jgi:hypothetical protein
MGWRVAHDEGDGLTCCNGEIGYRGHVLATQLDRRAQRNLRRAGNGGNSSGNAVMRVQTGDPRDGDAEIEA